MNRKNLKNKTTGPDRKGKILYALPFLLAIFTVVSFYETNADRLPPGTMVYPAIFSLGIAGLFLLLAWLNPLTNKSAPIIATAFTWVFLMWQCIPWVLSVVGLIAVIVVCRLYTVAVKHITGITFLVIIISLLFSGSMAIDINKNKDTVPISESYEYIPGQPNIYFIVPDRMPSPAAMRESGLDPDQLVSSLTALGFYVPDDNRSADLYTLDYPNKVYTTRTMRFFASVLNDGTMVPTEIRYQDCRSLIRDNTIIARLHGLGYQVINNASWFTETKKFSGADKNMTYGNINVFERFVQNELGEAYLNRTLLRGLPLRTLFDNTSMEKGRHEWQAQNILDIAAAGDTSIFSISHIMLPHEPYVYAESGLTTQEQYYANIEFAFTYLQDLAAGIRAHDPDAIIIIQSDEGMAYSKPPEINRELSPVQWSGVFTAWYFPPGSQPAINMDNISHTEILNVVVKSK